MPNHPTASAEDRFTGLRWAIAIQVSSARSSREYGGGACAPPNGVARRDGGPWIWPASAYSTDR
jgi:hypothetical protein